MAEGGNKMAEGGTDDDHEDARTCSICMEDFKDPKLLPCFHTFCLGCLQRLTSGVTAGKQFPCPVCRHQVTLPDAGPPGFQSNFYIEAAKTRRDFHATVCEICSKPATSRCKECVQSLCEGCTKVHSRLTLAKSHSLIRLRETSTYRPDVLNPEFCTKHVDERLRFHCNKCEQPICRDCKMTSHEGHSTADLEDVVDEGRQALSKLKYDFEKLETTFQKKESKVKDQILTFSKSVEEIKNNIDRETDDLITKINMARDSQKKAIEHVYLAEMKSLKTTDETINQDILFLKSHTGYISTLITGGCGADIMKAVTDMKDRFCQSKAEHEKEDEHHGLILCRNRISFTFNSTGYLCMSEPVPLEVVSEFYCSDGPSPDVISPVGNQQAWIAVKGRSGNGCVRLFTARGKRLKEFIINDIYHSKKEDGILVLIRCSDTEEKCQEIDDFRSDIKLKHKPKTETKNKYTCTVDILNQCVTVLYKSSLTTLKLSCEDDFAPVDVCWGPAKKLVIVDRASNSVLVYTPGDKKISSFVCGRRDGFRPCAVAWDGESRLWIGDLCGRVFVCKMP